MRSKAIVVVVAVSTALALWAATPDDKTKPANAVGAKKTAAKTSTAQAKSKGTKSSAGKKSASTGQTSAKSSSKQASSKQSSAKQAAAARFRRSTQREPVPDRYKEIQQSLADKGYFAGPVNGTWGPDSVEALKRFQRDQNIGDDGKLGSLSLIALGLGPKRGGEASGDAKPANPDIGGPSPP